MSTSAKPSLEELERSHEQLLEVLRLSRIGYAISDAESGRVYWSDTLFEQRKMNPRPFFTRAEVLSYIHPDDLPRYEAEVAAAIAERRSFRLEVRVRDGEGAEMWEDIIGQPRYGQAGDYLGLLAIARDVTGNRHNERVLRDQEATYRTLFDGIGDAVVLVRDGRFVAGNISAREMFRLAPEDLIGKSPVELSPERQPDGRLSSDAAATVIEAALRGERQVFEWRHSRSDGSEFDAEVTLNKVDIPGEAYFFGVVREISARKRADSDLREALAKWSAVFHLTPIATVLGRIGETVGAGIILDINEAAETTLGATRAQLVGKTIAEVSSILEASVIAEIRDRLTGEHHIRELTTTLTRFDGSTVDAEISGTLFTLNGQDHVMLLIRDVTAQRAAESQIRALNLSLDTRFRQLRDIADNMPALITYQDAEGRFQFVNRTAQLWFCKSEAELLGKTVPETMPADYVAATQHVRANRPLGTFHAENHMRFPDGVIRATECDYVQDIDEAGAVRGYYTLAVDITARKTVEQELKTAHDKLAAAFATSLDAMFVVRLGEPPGLGEILDINMAAQKMFGRRREDMIGAPINDTRTMSPALVEGWQQFLSDGTTRNLRLSPTRRGRSMFEAEVSGSRFFVDGKAHALIIVHDISERLEAERRIRELNESREANLRLLRSITDNVPVLITYQDAEGRFQFVNKMAQEWMSRSEAELLGKTVAETMPPEYLAVVSPMRERLLSGVFAKQGEMRTETTVRWPDGKTRTAEATYVYDVDDDGKLQGYYSLAADVSERKATEEQLRQSQRMDAIGKLTGGVAHDFNNLLAAILGSLELVEEKAPSADAELRTLLAPALRAAKRGATLTRSLLAFSRQQALSPAVLVLTSLVRDMADLMRRTVPANIEIEYVSGAGLWKCEADPGQLQNALLNLVVNARDAMPDGGKLTIETQNIRIDDNYAARHDQVTPGQYVLVAVSDTGSGMKREIVDRAFEPFFTTKGLGKGTGLGLSMVYGFAKQSKGHVAIYSEVGHGTTVRIYLPRWIGTEIEAPPRKRASAPAANKETILVVEDDEDVRFVTATVLRSKGYTILEAADGAGALRILQEKETIDLIVTDVVLAGEMNGRRLAEEAAGLRPGIKVLFMSGYTEDAIVHHGRLDPGVDFIQKPFENQALAAKVRGVLDG